MQQSLAKEPHNFVLTNWIHFMIAIISIETTPTGKVRRKTIWKEKQTSGEALLRSIPGYLIASRIAAMTGKVEVSLEVDGQSMEKRCDIPAINKLTASVKDLNQRDAIATEILRRLSDSTEGGMK